MEVIVLLTAEPSGLRISLIVSAAIAFVSFVPSWKDDVGTDAQAKSQPVS